MYAQTPFFSIIIPTFNRAQLLPVAIKSVINQIYTNWELLIIDDGSADQTESVIAQFRDQRIRYIYQTHQERSIARNRGIHEAKGNYICFLDDDDYYLNNHLSTFFQELQKSNFPQTILRTGFIRKKGEKLVKSAQYIQSRDKNPVSFAAFQFCSTCTLCIPKACLSDFNFPVNFHYWEDTHLILRILSQFAFLQLPVFTYVYVQHLDRSSKTIYQKHNALELIQNNIQAINDFFICHPRITKAFLHSDTRSRLISYKYIDHANGALKHQKIVLSLYLITAAISNHNIFPFLEKYIKFALKFPIYWLYSLINRERSSLP